MSKEQASLGLENATDAELESFIAFGNALDELKANESFKLIVVQGFLRDFMETVINNYKQAKEAGNKDACIGFGKQLQGALVFSDYLDNIVVASEDAKIILKERENNE